MSADSLPVGSFSLDPEAFSRRKRGAEVIYQRLQERLEDGHPDIGRASVLVWQIAHAETRTDLEASESELAELGARHSEPPEGFEPEPEPPDFEESSWQPFPVEVLPAPVRRYVRESARALGTDPAFVAQPLLAAIAGAVGTSLRVVLKEGSWSEPPILWTATIAESGSGKTPGLDLGTKPLKERQALAYRRHAEAMERYQLELEDYAAAKRRKETRTPPEKPILEHFILNDTTVEGLAGVLSENGRVLIARDELSGWVASFDKYTGAEGSDVACWLELYGGNAYMLTRKTSGTVYIPAAAVSITGGIQPGTLRHAVGEKHRENGLLARLLVAQPPRKPREWSEDLLDPSTATELDALFARLYDLAPDHAPDGTERPRLVRLTPEARALWIDYFTEHAKTQTGLTGDLAAMSSKLEGGAGRLALVIHCAKTAGTDQENRLDAESMRAGITLARWYHREAERVYVRLLEKDEDRHTREAFEYIHSKGDRITARDLARGPARFRGAGGTEAAENFLRESEASGLVTLEEMRQDRGGWPLREYVMTEAALRLIGLPPSPKRHSAGNPEGNGRVSLSQGLETDTHSGNGHDPQAGTNEDPEEEF